MTSVFSLEIFREIWKCNCHFLLWRARQLPSERALGASLAANVTWRKVQENIVLPCFDLLDIDFAHILTKLLDTAGVIVILGRALLWL